MLALLQSTLRAALIAAALLPVCAAAQPDPAAPGADIERGRYLVRIGGCNDCHTPGYAQSGGTLPEKLWLTGDTFGWRGPWGTTYATNLRLLIAGMTEPQWLERALTLRARPPMPWFNVTAMKPADLSAIYRYVRTLGPAGTPAPDYLPPGKVPPPPFAVFPEPPVAAPAARPTTLRHPSAALAGAMSASAVLP